MGQHLSFLSTPKQKKLKTKGIRRKRTLEYSQENNGDLGDDENSDIEKKRKRRVSVTKHRRMPYLEHSEKEEEEKRETKPFHLSQSQWLEFEGYKVGDIAYRKGEKIEITKINLSLDPPSVEVRV